MRRRKPDRAASGFSDTKRVAIELVDPYSSNPVLQHELNGAAKALCRRDPFYCHAAGRRCGGLSHHRSLEFIE